MRWVRRVAEALADVEDVEQLLIDYYTASPHIQALGASVSTRVEDGLHLRVVLTGNPPERDMVIGPVQITLEAHASTQTGAAALMRVASAETRALRGTMLGASPVYAVGSFGAGGNQTDPVTRRARYSKTHTLDLRLLPL